MRTMQRRALALSLLAATIAGCAHTETPPTVLEPAPTPKLSVLEQAYDRAKWKWVRNPDGRTLLSHTEIAKCFVDPEPPLDLHDPGFTLKKREKVIGETRYQVIDVYEKRDFWEAIYIRPGAAKPILGVYAAGKCQQEAERILEAYEKSLKTAR
jgi:hypothetical protein